MRNNHTIKSWFMATRPWSFSTSAMPVIVTLSFLYYNNYLVVNPLSINWINGILAIVAIVILHFAGNLLSDYNDYKQGVDTSDAFGAKSLTSGEFKPKEIRNAGFILLAIGIVLGLLLTLRSGWQLLWIGAIGVAAIVLYSKLKFNYFGDFCVFIAFGLIPPLGTVYVATSIIMPYYFLLSIPVGLLTVGLLHSNNTRDIKRDSEAGISTFAMALGLKKSIIYYYLLILIPFIWIAVFAILGIIPKISFLTYLLLPMAIKNLIIMNKAKNDITAITFLDLRSAKLQMLFSIVLTISFIIPTLSI